MKKLIFLKVFLYISLFAHSQNKAKISGVIKGIGNQMIYLKNKPEGITNAFVPISYDSVFAKNDSFQFNINFKEIDFYSLEYNGFKGWLPFIIDTGLITINATKDLLYKGQVSGSNQNDIYNNYRNTISEPFYKANRRYFDSADKYRTTDSSLFNYYENDLKDKEVLYLKEQKDFIKNHPDSYTALKLIYENLQIFSKDTLNYYYSVLASNFKNHPLGRDIEYRIISFEKNVEVGALIPNFILNDKNGKQTKLYAIHSNYKILSFWASWCKPCLEEIPFLKMIDSNYKNASIISISLDTEKSEWVESGKNNKIFWYSFSDLNGFKGEIAKYFSLQAIPFLILLDEKNRIIRYSMKPTELVSILNQNKKSR